MPAIRRDDLRPSSYGHRQIFQRMTGARTKCDEFVTGRFRTVSAPAIYVFLLTSQDTVSRSRAMFPSLGYPAFLLTKTSNETIG